MIDFNHTTTGIIQLTVGNWDLMEPHMNAIYETFPFPKEFYIVVNQDYKLSVSQALNKGLKWALDDGVDHIIYIADDCFVGPECIQNTIGYLYANNAWLSLAHGAFNIFAVSSELFEEVGFFDEYFEPAYYEDNDMRYRINLIDKSKMVNVPAELAPAEHVGSATLKRWPQERIEKHHEQFRINQTRYIAKWGGLPTEEKFTEPFDGKGRPEEIMPFPAIGILTDGI